MKKFLNLFFAALIAIPFVPCQDNCSSGKILFEGTIEKVDSYGGLLPSFRTESVTVTIMTAVSMPVIIGLDTFIQQI